MLYIWSIVVCIILHTSGPDIDYYAAITGGIMAGAEERRYTHQGTPASLCWATEKPNMQSSQLSLGPSCTTRLFVSMLKPWQEARRESRRRRNVSMTKWTEDLAWGLSALLFILRMISALLKCSILGQFLSFTTVRTFDTFIIANISVNFLPAS